jgi:hypothetical protein
MVKIVEYSEMVFSGKPILIKAKCMCSRESESQASDFFSKDRWPCFSVCLVSVWKTFRRSRESCVKILGSTERVLPLRISCLTITLVILLYITLNKTFCIVFSSVIGCSDLMVPLYGESPFRINIILGIVQLGGTMPVSRILLNSWASLLAI